MILAFVKLPGKEMSGKLTPTEKADAYVVCDCFRHIQLPNCRVIEENLCFSHFHKYAKTPYAADNEKCGI